MLSQLRAAAGNRKIGRNWIWLSGAAALLILTAFLSGIFPTPRNIPGNWTEAPVAAPAALPQLQANPVTVAGRAVPETWAELSLRRPGVVEAVRVKEGQKVTSGQVLLRLQDDDLQLAVAEAEAALATAEARLAEAKAAPTDEGLAQARAAVKVAEANLEASKARLASAEAGVDAARGDLSADRAALSRLRTVLARTEAGADPHDLTMSEMQVARARNELWRTQERPGEGPADAVAEADVDIAEADLAYLRSLPTEDQLSLARDDVEEVEAQVSASQARLAQAEATVDEMQAEIDASQARHEDAEAALERLLAGLPPEAIAVYEAQLEEAKAALATAQANLGQAELVAPFAGTVVSVSTRVGELVPENLPVLVLADLDTFRVESIDLDELDVTRIEVGDRAEITFDALLDQPTEGTVSSVALRGNSTELGTYYPVVIELAETPTGLRWGMIAQIEINP